jgi:CHASE3 domain sensor protein
MGKKIFAATVFLVIAMVTTGYLFFFQEKFSFRLEEEARVQEILSLIYDAQGNLSDAESITRGFILTGDEEFLKIFQKALLDLNQTLDRLNRMTANEPEPQRLLGELSILIGQRQAFLQVAIDLRRMKGSGAPEHVILAREGTKVQNEIRRTFEQLEDYGKKMLDADWRKEKGRTQTWVWALNLGTLGSLSLLLLSLYLLNRESNQRKKAETQLAGYQEDLRSCTSQLSLAEEHERRRIAGHLHDEISQTITFATIRLREL